MSNVNVRSGSDSDAYSELAREQISSVWPSTKRPPLASPSPLRAPSAMSRATQDRGIDDRGVPPPTPDAQVNREFLQQLGLLPKPPGRPAQPPSRALTFEDWAKAEDNRGPTPMASIKGFGTGLAKGLFPVPTTAGEAAAAAGAMVV